MAQQNKNLNLIQMLRGIASLLVVCYHATSNSNETLHRHFLFDFFLFGGSGVDIFFVLSGFIITYTTIKGNTQPGNLLPFLRRRFVRIFPTYWIIISVFLALQILLPSFYATHFSLSAANLISTYLLFPGHTMVNGVSWSLSSELFFYLLFVLVFLLPQKKWAFLAFAIYAVIIILLPLAGYNFEKGNSWISLITFPMNVEFFMGVLAALLIPVIASRYSMPLIIGGSVLYLASGIFYNQGYQILPNSFNRVLLFGIPSFFVITGIVKYELTARFKVPGFLVSLGEASYSLYLLHLPVVAAFAKLVLKFNIESNLVIQVLLIVLIIAICFSAVLFYKLIEKPVIRKLNDLLNRKAYVRAGSVRA